MTKTKIAIFAITSILLSATMMAQEVYAPNAGTVDDIKGLMRPAIPDWVDQNFRWYAEEQISQTDLINSLEFLVTERIILLPSVVQTAEGQEITQSIEELQQRIDQLEYFDEEEFEVIMAIEDPEERKISCKKLDGGTKIACWSINAGLWILEKITEEKEQQMEQQLEMLSEEIKKAQMIELDETPSIPAGATGTYVNYKKGTPVNYRLTVECDPGDVATGGGFAPAIKFGFEQDYLASMPYPANYANNPRMNNPTGWTYLTMDGSEARVWVVCLDLTPASLSAGTIP